MTDPSFFAKTQAGKPLPTTAGGASGYFSAPAPGLDPNLFDGTALKQEVRSYITGELAHGLALVFDGHATIQSDWLHIWLAGSGVTYQWSASRGNGDLDVLFSMDIVPFEQDNPGWRGTSEADLALAVNEGLKAQLWPQTSRTRFGNQVYEVTFFWNPGTGKDIRNIHPYAAYDVVTGTWAVPPPQLPENPRDLYPASWYQSAAADTDAADALSEAYGRHLGTLASSAPDTPDYHNASSALNVVVAKARALWEDIHLGRREAFGPQGHGYGDYHNFRWQVAKESGAAQVFRLIAAAGDEARAAEETARYGAPIDSAEVALRRAMNSYRNRP